MDDAMDKVDRQEPLAAVEEGNALDTHLNDSVLYEDVEDVEEPSHVHNAEEVKEEVIRDEGVLPGAHVGAFRNATETPEAVDIEVQGSLPEWLLGELYTLGPGVYDINYPRKIEVDGELETATATFSFGHWFDSLPLLNRFDIYGDRNVITYTSRFPNKRLIGKIRDRHGYMPQYPGGLFKTNTNQSVLGKFLKTSTDIKQAKPDSELCSSSVRVGLAGQQGKLYAYGHGGNIQELDPFDLTPTHIFTPAILNAEFKGVQTSPHPIFDPYTGEYINVVLEVGYQRSVYRVFATTEQEPHGYLLGSVESKASPVHSFAITAQYVILVIYPFYPTLNGTRFSWNESVMDSFEFTSREPTFFYIFSREKKEHVATYKTDPCFAFHHCNAFEDDSGNIYVDICTYEDDTIAHQLSLEQLRHPEQMKPADLAIAELRRYKLSNITEAILAASRTPTPAASPINQATSAMFSLVRGAFGGRNVKYTHAPLDVDNVYLHLPKAEYERICDAPLELPCINAAYQRFRHRHVYGVGFSEETRKVKGSLWDSIIKADVEAKGVVAVWHEPGCFPSEAKFIGRPYVDLNDAKYSTLGFKPAFADGEDMTQVELDTKEDEGVLVSVIYDSNRNKSFLLFLDAQTMTEVGRAQLPHPVPMSFASGDFRLRNLQP
ncbi:hypothetical protein BZG36_02439 [Bifiguratus adelaidae]|uniref:Carotenoid oxygenase n=1 Tax=Bifiguratus adelaidae TaxID=1938954 RepID=A0A261Y416_9FUNG|nr:hypothetical protein BZG36_02439 [Bifiguratus adelaidae]